MKLSVIVPCYNEEKTVEAFFEKTSPILRSLCKEDFEIIFVDDGSIDHTLAAILNLQKKFQSVEYLSFSKNFGKESAMLAGMEYARGEYVAIMDADLQDSPELLREMFVCLEQEDYDCVAARRVDRKGEPPIRSFFARCFYKLINRISDVEIMDGARDFRLMKRHVVTAILSLPERNRFSKGIFSWVGFKTKWLEYENVERIDGTSKWSFWKLFCYSLEGIFAFSTIPLAISSVMGIILCIVSFVAIVFFVYQKLFVGIDSQGWATMMCLILMLGGIQLFCIGVLGQYLAKVYTETKQRPLYLIKKMSIERTSSYADR